MSQLLGGIIDYAGLFPPARLPMSESVRNYVAFLSGDERWIVNRFICPASRLEELGEELSVARSSNPIRLCVLGSGGAEIDAFESNLEADAKAMTLFESNFGDSAPIEAFEVRVPTGENLSRALRDLKAFSAIEMFVEMPVDSELEANLSSIADQGELGAKWRTGGVDGSMFPSATKLASFLTNVIDLGLEFKLTAGLHEPIRHFDPVLDAYHHGFLNVLAAVLAHDADHASTSEMTEILENDSPMSFTIDDDEFCYQGRRYPSRDVEDARSLFVGFGSCSVDEPLSGLERLGWMGAL